MGNVVSLNEEKKNEEKNEEKKNEESESPHTLTDMGSESESSEETTSPVVVLTSTVPVDLEKLLEDAIITCARHKRPDIINTYVCNLQATPKDVFEVANDLQYIARLDLGNINSTFVPIGY